MAPDDERHLLTAIEIAWRARRHGNHPFGALLVDADGNSALEAENTVLSGNDCTGHAETNLMRMASREFSPAFRQGCTIYTSSEPCAMCAGAIYWTNVRRVVFALSQLDLSALTGSDPDSLVLPIPCREVFARGQHDIDVVGPDLVHEALAVHEGFWEAASI